MSNVPEQTTVWIPTPRASLASIGTSYGIHPEEDIEEQANTLYETHLPTSVRRYQTTMPTVIRVTKHQGPPPIQRASRTQEPERPHIPTPVQHPQRYRWLTSVGVGMVLMAFGFIVVSGTVHWWQERQETIQYGYPRTYQTDANVKHGGMNHFTVENLHGQIIIIEVQPNDLSHSHVYDGSDFSGTGADLKVATITFQDINGDGNPDMIVAVDGERFLFINDHDAFRAANPSDTIKGGNF